MKKLLVVLFVLALAVPTFAADNPANQGNFVVSAGLFNYEQASGDLYKPAGAKTPTDTTFGLAINDIAIQYFVIPSLAVGGYLMYNQYKDQAGDKTTTTTIAPKISYFMTMDALLPFVSIAYEYSKKSNGTSAKSTSIPIELGVAYMLGKNIAVYGAVYYAMDKEESVKGSRLGFDIGFKGFF